MKKILLTLVFFVSLSTGAMANNETSKISRYNSVEPVKCIPTSTRICIPGQW